jgi:hypothetical protein
MTSPSVSFRISRNTEELAETIHALSRRLVAVEQRLVAMEHQVAQAEEAAVEEIDPQESASLANVERLLLDCRQLLAVEAPVIASFSAGLAGAEPDDEELNEEEEPRASGFRHAA